MREIKFRAWDARNHKMFIPPELIHPPLEVGYFDDSGCPKGMNSAPLMQYTGLKDKNGKEIYEGDIIKHPQNGRNLIVKYDFGAFVGKWFGLNEYIFFNDMANDEDSIEVIGNIYENPELLEVK